MRTPGIRNSYTLLPFPFSGLTLVTQCATPHLESNIEIIGILSAKAGDSQASPAYLRPFGGAMNVSTRTGVVRWIHRVRIEG